MPAPLPKRDTSSFLRPLAQLMVDELGLTPPTPEQPGHWTTPTGFLTVSTALIKDGFQSKNDRFRALVSFHPRDTQTVTNERIRKLFPSYDEMPQEKRRQVWARILQIGKHARTERVSEIIRELEQKGIDVPVQSLQVHRVSYTFFVTVDLDLLKALVELHQDGYEELRKIHISKVASF